MSAFDGWIDEQLARHGITRTGAVETLRERPWATVHHAETDAGRVWLKAAGPGTAFEPGLYALLNAVAPEAILRPLGVDTERAWLLLPDGGPPVGAARSDDDAAVIPALPAYARLQRALAPRVDELLALGVTDMRAPVMPERFEQALAVVEPSADPGTFARLQSMRGRVAEWSEQLAAAPVAPSLDHNDLHARNILAGNRFYDWGDSVVAHPFASLLVVLSLAEDKERTRDAYLAVFEDLAPRAELLATLDVALRLANIARSLVWHRAISSMDGDLDPEWAEGPLHHLATLLDA